MANCVNHPERAAVEHCEVCGSPLCAFCLYYTSDGQRLCKLHADQAEAAGAFIRDPGTYAGGLLPAQVSASVKKHDVPLFEGNTPDVVALIALVLGLVSVSLCFPPVCCLIGPIGVILSLVALLGTKEARNVSRTRLMAGIGLTFSALWIMAFACFALWFLPLLSGNVFVSTNQFQMTLVAPIQVQPQGTVVVPTIAPPATSAATPSPTPSLGR